MHTFIWKYTFISLQLIWLWIFLAVSFTIKYEQCSSEGLETSREHAEEEMTAKQRRRARQQREEVYSSHTVLLDSQCLSIGHEFFIAPVARHPPLTPCLCRLSSVLPMPKLSKSKRPRPSLFFERTVFVLWKGRRGEVRAGWAGSNCCSTDGWRGAFNVR